MAETPSSSPSGGNPLPMTTDLVKAYLSMLKDKPLLGTPVGLAAALGLGSNALALPAAELALRHGPHAINKTVEYGWKAGEWTTSKSISLVQEATRRAAGYAYHGAAAPIQGGYEIGKSALVNGTHMAIDLGFKPAIAAPFNATRGAALAVLGGLTLPGQVLGHIPGFRWTKTANDKVWDATGNAFKQSARQITQPFKGESWRPAADFAQTAWTQTAITAGRMAYAPTQIVAPEWGQKNILGTAVNIAQRDGSVGAAFGSAQQLQDYNRNKIKRTIGKLPGFSNAANDSQYSKTA